MTPENNVEKLTELLREAHDRLDSRKAIEISASKLTDLVINKIDPSKRSPSLMRSAAYFGLMSLAGKVCAARHSVSEAESETGELFEFRLQNRYPTTRNGEKAYVLRERLSYEERMENISRLRREATAKSAHADTLQAETNTLVRQGKLKLSVMASNDERQPPALQ